MNRLYAYKNCDTCRKATRFLRENDIPFQEIPIRESPPDPDVIRAALTSADGDLRRLFNTSGTDYRQHGLKNRLPTLTEDEAIALLAAHGNLVKRPLLFAGETILIGFRPDDWQAALHEGKLA